MCADSLVKASQGAYCGSPCEPYQHLWVVISAATCFYCSLSLCCVLAQAGLRCIFSTTAVTYIVILNTVNKVSSYASVEGFSMAAIHTENTTCTLADRKNELIISVYQYLSVINIYSRTTCNPPSRTEGPSTGPYLPSLEGEPL